MKYIIIHGQPLAKMIGRLARLKAGKIVFDRYKNGELYVSSCSRVLGENVLLFASFAPPDFQLLETLLAAHTLKKEGAKKVIGLTPFLAYMRDDKQRKGKSLTTQWLGRVVRASYMDEIITVDLHSELAKNLVPIPITSLSPADLFAREIQAMDLKLATIIAPDQGAIKRAKRLQKSLQNKFPIAFFQKKRTAKRIVISTPKGALSRRAILIDDQLDTGDTLIAACKQLKKLGVFEIYIFVTHGIFTGSRWKQLRSLGVSRLVTTDTIFHKNLPHWVLTISVAPLLKKTLQNYE